MKDQNKLLLHEVVDWVFDMVEGIEPSRILFSCCGCVSWVVWEKTGVLCENSIVNHFENWVFVWGSGKLFWDSWNLNFSVDYDRAKCQERVGENGNENGLTVWILSAKWWKTHFLKSWFLDLMLSKLCRDFCSRDTILLAECSVVSGHKIVTRFWWTRFFIFHYFTPFSVLNWPLV